MNDETPIDEEKRTARRLRNPRMPAALESAWFALQERAIWPLQDRVADRGSASDRASLADRLSLHRNALLGGGAFAAFVVVLVVLTTSGGPTAPPTTLSEAPTQREPLTEATAATPTAPAPEPEKAPEPKETLHGAAKPAGKAARGESAKSESAGAANSSASESTSSPTPDAARISSDPDKPASAGTDSKTAGAAGAATDDPAAAARAAVPDGPPAGPEALKVAREFAKGFVVYETGGEKSAFRDAFEASATPELTKALMARPPKQPAGVKVPKAKVLNVVAGPSQGSVYKVSVSLLRVGVTSELRLDMEKVEAGGKATGGPGKGAEWRVTNVLG